METDTVSTFVEATLAMLQRDEISMAATVALSPAMITEPIQWVFNILPAFDSDFAAVMDWLKTNWTGARPPRVGLIVYDTAGACIALEAKDYAPKIGVEFVGYEVVPISGVIDTSTEWLRLAAKKPDLIYSWKKS